MDCGIVTEEKEEMVLIPKRDYIRYIAFGEMGFKPGEITLYRNGVQVRTGKINIEK